MTALIAAVAHTERPYRPLSVGDQLDLHVAGRSDGALHQHARVAEGLLGLRPGALERLRNLIAALNQSHPPTTTAGGSLDHQWEAELLAVPKRLIDAVDGTAAPGCDGHSGALGDTLAFDLVAQRPHHVRVGTGKDNSESIAQLCERGMLGHEPPPHPRRIRARLDEGARE